MPGSCGWAGAGRPDGRQARTVRSASDRARRSAAPRPVELTQPVQGGPADTGDAAAQRPVHKCSALGRLQPVGGVEQAMQRCVTMTRRHAIGLPVAGARSPSPRGLEQEQAQLIGIPRGGKFLHRRIAVAFGPHCRKLRQPQQPRPGISCGRLRHAAVRALADATWVSRTTRLTACWQGRRRKGQPGTRLPPHRTPTRRGRPAHRPRRSTGCLAGAPALRPGTWGTARGACACSALLDIFDAPNTAGPGSPSADVGQPQASHLMLSPGTSRLRWAPATPRRGCASRGAG